MRHACMEALPVEVLSIVLDFLARAKNKHVNLASAVRINRLWHDVAANYLWESVDLLNVLKLLPDDVWCFHERDEAPFDKNSSASAESEQHEDDAIIPSVINGSKDEGAFNNPVFILLRAIKQSEWEGVMHYTSRIKALHTAALRCDKVDWDFFDILSNHAQHRKKRLSYPSVYERIYASRPRTRLFPNLRHLHAENAVVQHSYILRIFASDHLCSTWFSSLNFWVPPRIITRLSDDAPTLTDTLEILDTDTIDASLLATFRGLQDVTIHRAASDIWDVLSTLPLLHTLYLVGPDLKWAPGARLGIEGPSRPTGSELKGSTSESTPGSPVPPAKVSFPKLEGLYLSLSDGSYARDALPMLSTLSNNAHLKRLYVYAACGPDSESEAEDTTSIGDDVRLLVAFCNLEAVHLDITRAFNAAEIDLMARSWPLLEKLCLPSIALSGLVALAKHCPRLRHLRTEVYDVERERDAWVARNRAAKIPTSETLATVALKCDDCRWWLRDFCRFYTEKLFPNAVHEPYYAYGGWRFDVKDACTDD